MKKWKRYLSLRRMVVALAAVAVAVPAAQASAQVPRHPGSTQPATAETAKLSYGIPVSSYRRLPADDQQALQHPRSVAIGGYSPSVAIGDSSPPALGKTNPVRTSTPVVSETSNTFNWDAAGFWTASGLVLTSFAALGALLVRRGRMGQPAV
jgi:hypothetical protein